MKKSLKLIEKVAMTWTAPLMFLVVLILSMLAILFFLLATFLNISGTIGASLYLIDQVRIRTVGFRLKKLMKKDEKLHNFDKSMKKE